MKHFVNTMTDSAGKDAGVQMVCDRAAQNGWKVDKVISQATGQHVYIEAQCS